jgi:hypothetical protein
MVGYDELMTSPRAENLSVTDHPHERYYDCGVPVLTSTPVGKVVDTSVTRTTTHCPDCDVPARNYDGEPICPLCGLVCQGKDSESKQLVIDAKAAGRIETDSPRPSSA